ncbi:hypothetical protein XENORESO_016221 [Xenotaenia resolanae]|uniref:Uncharacterized protein n=1 Tax=Xenotaenia resolanae TaxID=208358 RepID=A0ABV0VSJ1_9TELE
MVVRGMCRNKSVYVEFVTWLCTIVSVANTVEGLQSTAPKSKKREVDIKLHLRSTVGPALKLVASKAQEQQPLQASNSPTHPRGNHRSPDGGPPLQDAARAPTQMASHLSGHPQTPPGNHHNSGFRRTSKGSMAGARGPHHAP